jgi:hypothetical protein
MGQELRGRLLNLESRFHLVPVHVGCVEDRMALGQDNFLSASFFPFQFSFHQLSKYVHLRRRLITYVLTASLNKQQKSQSVMAKNSKNE